MNQRNEGEILRRISRRFDGRPDRAGQPRVVLGMGDDAAILSSGANHELVISSDMFLEGTHFLRRLYSPESVGYKALARAVSDLAAMGAKPHSFLLTIGLPAAATGKWLNGFLAGLQQAAETFRIALIGGDATRYSSIILEITVLGTVPGGKAVLRSGTRPGDIIFVTGQLGAAELGRRLLPQRPGIRLTRPTMGHPLLSAQMFPQPPIEFAQRLAAEGLATAMIDLSDGLSSDLTRLCEASGVGARIEVSSLPLVRIPRIRSARKEDPVELALHGGEDYGLLFTCHPPHLARLRKISRSQKITPIGDITRSRKIEISDALGNVKILAARGWDPFRD
jgi:thiamine-monophosphate kinase